jgi:hypothetical protein
MFRKELNSEQHENRCRRTTKREIVALEFIYRCGCFICLSVSFVSFFLRLKRLRVGFACLLLRVRRCKDFDFADCAVLSAAVALSAKECAIAFGQYI